MMIGNVIGKAISGDDGVSLYPCLLRVSTDGVGSGKSLASVGRMSTWSEGPS